MISTDVHSAAVNITIPSLPLRPFISVNKQMLTEVA